MLRVLSNLRKLNPICEFTWSRYQNTVKKTLSTCKVATAKVHVDHENAYAYGLLGGSLCGNKNKQWKAPTQETLTQEAFNRLLDQDFRTKSATEIVTTFERAQPFCARENLQIADNRFDRLVDGLMDHADKLTDDELIKLLDVLQAYPECDSINAHNFHDVWSCLDDMCLRRVPRWSYDQLFAVSDRWFKLNMGKICDFIFEAVDKMSRKPERKLSKDQLVSAFFLMNVSRKRDVTFEFEHALHMKMDQMSVDELAIVALGYFKTQSRVRMPQILTEMLRKAKEAPQLHEMTLCAILKVVRFAPHPSLSDQVHDFLVYITPKLHDYSTLCVLHAALLGTTLQLEYQPVLQLAAQRIAGNITDVGEVRLKDIERLLLALTMFDYDPATEPCVYRASLEELHADDRRNYEFIRHSRCLAAALSFLCIRNMYSHELLRKVLHQDYINDVYGKSAKTFPRELFILDTNIDIEVDGYEGPRLDVHKRHKVAKWLTAFTPSKTHGGKKLTSADKLILNVHDIVEDIVSGSDNMLVEHVLPQYLRADIVISRNKATKQYVKPAGFDGYTLGDVMRPQHTDQCDFFAIVTVGWNNTIRNTTKPVGMINMKLRHLAKIGFKPITVIWCDFSPLSNADKRKYIENKIDDAT